MAGFHGEWNIETAGGYQVVVMLSSMIAEAVLGGDNRSWNIPWLVLDSSQDALREIAVVCYRALSHGSVYKLSAQSILYIWNTPTHRSAAAVQLLLP